MRHYLYKLIGSDPAPAGGDTESWLYYYKWGRPELVALPRREHERISGIQPGDGLFIVLDNVVIGFTTVEDVQEGYVANVAGPVQEIWIYGYKILEFKKGHRIRLKGAWKNLEIPTETMNRWVARPYSSAKFKPLGEEEKK